MNSRLILSSFILLTSASAFAQENPSPYRAHDPKRPKPPVVTPSRIKEPVLAPSDAIVLFEGDDLSQWRSGDGPAKWAVKDGYMESGAGFLQTADSFGDVQLHVEWAAPVPVKGKGQGRGNSGIFLMGKYEIQVLDSFENETYADGQAAAIYGQAPPLVNASLPPGEWQTFDVVFRRPRFDGDKVVSPAELTIFHNGILVQENKKLWGPTSWLKHEPYVPHADELPISIQDHGNPVRYRNIWVRKLPDRVVHTCAKRLAAKADWSNEKVKSVVGKYGQYHIRSAEGKLRLEWGDRSFDLVPTSENRLEFKSTSAHVDVEFHEGKAEKITVNLMGGRRTAERED